MLSFILLHGRDFVVVQCGHVVTLCLSIRLYISINSNGVRLAVRIDVFAHVFDGTVLTYLSLLCLDAPERERSLPDQSWLARGLQEAPAWPGRRPFGTFSGLFRGVLSGLLVSVSNTILLS